MELTFTFSLSDKSPTLKSTGREAAWNLTATLDTHLNVFLDNLKALGYKFRDLDFTWDIDSTVENTSKLVSYDNVNLIDALTQMAETWECEWWIEIIRFVLDVANIAPQWILKLVICPTART